MFTIVSYKVKIFSNKFDIVRISIYNYLGCSLTRLRKIRITVSFQSMLSINLESVFPKKKNVYCIVVFFVDMQQIFFMIMLEYVFKTIYVSIYKISKMFFLSSEIQNSNVPYCCVKVYFESHETIYIVLKRIRLIFWEMNNSFCTGLMAG